jgi:hypothetical protein
MGGRGDRLAQGVEYAHEPVTQLRGPPTTLGKEGGVGLDCLVQLRRPPAGLGNDLIAPETEPGACLASIASRISRHHRHVRVHARPSDQPLGAITPPVEQISRLMTGQVLDERRLEGCHAAMGEPTGI